MNFSHAPQPFAPWRKKTRAAARVFFSPRLQCRLPHRRGVTIKVDSVGHPYRTPAMRAALLKALAEAQN